MDLGAFASTLSLLRARIEAGLERPAVLAVTSARPRDGKSLVSYGLAANFAETNYKVLFVDADERSERALSNAVPSLSDKPEFDVCAYVKRGIRNAPDMLDLSNPAVAESGSINAVRAAFDRFRQSYDYTVIDTSVIGSSGLALLLSAASDGVIVAVRDGRSVTKADKDISVLLRTAGANLIGAVTADRSAIRAFRDAADRRDSTALVQVHPPYEEARKRASQAEVAS